jgi:hypothetical protein
MDAMLDELVQEKLVEDRSSLTSLELNETTLVINGKQQPESVHSRYKQKYLKGTQKSIQYHSNGGSRTITLK